MNSADWSLDLIAWVSRVWLDDTLTVLSAMVYTNNIHLEPEDTSITMWLKLMVFHVEFGKLGHLSSTVDIAQILDHLVSSFKFLEKKYVTALFRNIIHCPLTWGDDGGDWRGALNRRADLEFGVRKKFKELSVNFHSWLFSQLPPLVISKSMAQKWRYYARNNDMYL